MRRRPIRGGVVQRARFRLGGATISWTVLIFFSGEITSTIGTLPSGVIAAKSRTGLADVGLDRRRGDDGVGVDEDRVTVRIGLGDSDGADGRAAARTVVDDDRLADLGRNLFSTVRGTMSVALPGV